MTKPALRCLVERPLRVAINSDYGRGEAVDSGMGDSGPWHYGDVSATERMTGGVVEMKGLDVRQRSVQATFRRDDVLGTSVPN